MNTQNIPKLVTLKTGESFKVYQVTGHAGMKMPLHYSTKEAVVIVQEGFAQLQNRRNKTYASGRKYVYHSSSPKPYSFCKRQNLKR